MSNKYLTLDIVIGAISKEKGLSLNASEAQVERANKALDSEACNINIDFYNPATNQTETLTFNADDFDFFFLERLHDPRSIYQWKRIQDGTADAMRMLLLEKYGSIYGRDLLQHFRDAIRTSKMPTRIEFLNRKIKQWDEIISNFNKPNRGDEGAQATIEQ